MMICKKVGIIQKLAILPLLFLIVKAEFPVDSDEIVPTFGQTRSTDYRLPETLDPIHYDVELTPYFEATETRESFTFDGVVSITVNALEDDITQLVVQDNVREVFGVTVTDVLGAIVPLNLMNPFERIRQYQFLNINLREGTSLTRGSIYNVHITYLGFMNETPLPRGMFRGSYVNTQTGVRHWYAATHLQPTHARQLFPSFDEPGFKSTFSIIVNRPASYIDTYSNMPVLRTETVGDRVREIFETTPIMSAYLVTVHISEEFTVIADNNDAERPFRILARPDAAGQGDYALEIGVPLTAWLENYFNISYYTMGDGMKNDQIASPDWASGATENWGLVTYRELRLLYEQGETNAVDKLSIATIISHELAHKWFGNLITARWWNNVWINEGYASYFEYFATHEVDPSLELEDQFNIMYVQSTLSADSATNTRALEHTVNSPAEVTNHFSGISYSKGASLLMMLRHFLTPPTFQKALQIFLRDRSYQHAFPEHIYAGFAAAVQEDNALTDFSDVDIIDFMRYWVLEPGYPVLNVVADTASGQIRLEQERFFISPDASPTNQVWPLPLTFTTQSNPDWENRRASHVMTESTLTINTELGDEWVIFNVKQSGIYRVNYDMRNWERIADTLKTNPSSIHPLNRAQIVDDVFALMRSERMTYDFGFSVLEFLKNETNFYVWYPAITGFTFLRNRFLHMPRIAGPFDVVIYEYLSDVIDNLGYIERPNDNVITIYNRFYTMAFACSIGHEGCVNNAVAQYQNFQSSGIRVNPNLRRHVFCSGLLAGGYESWQLLRNHFRSSNNQAAEIVYLRALGCTTNDQARLEYLETILTDEVRAQDRVNAFTYLFMGHRDNAKVALDFIKERHNDIRQVVSAFGSVLSNLASYLDENGLNDMEQWLESNTSIPEYATGINGIASARSNMEWGNQRGDAILRAVRGSAFVIVPTTFLLLTALITVLFK